MSTQTATRFDPPPETSASMWIDEAVWGHRLHDEQNPWLVFMEFLNVYSHELACGRALVEEGGPNTLRYRPKKRLHLRSVLFNNPKIKGINLLPNSDSYRWTNWLKEAPPVKDFIDTDFSYLRNRFHEFRSFADVIELIQTTSLELSSNKRWTSKFVFPYGEDCLYEDLDKNARTNDRRFFGRTGELLYLMLCRSTQAPVLTELFNSHLFFQDSTWNRIVRALQPTEVEDPREPKGGSFLPYAHHKSYDELSEDWIALLRLQIPGYDAFPHLVTVVGLHLLLYQLRVAKELISDPEPLRLVCEIVAPKKTLVREISASDYQLNNLLSTQAVTEYIASIERSYDWQTALQQYDSFLACRHVLESKTLWGSDYTGANTPENLIDNLKQDALKRHKQHVSNIHRVYGREIGLVSRRGTTRLRYAPTDELLKALVFANVESRQELGQFFERLWTRYGMVLGDRQAERVLAKEEFDKKAFQANARRLEQRLTSLGLVKRLSDGCAYIINPFSHAK